MFIYMGRGAELGMGEFHQACKLISNRYEVNFHTVFFCFQKTCRGKLFFIKFVHAKGKSKNSKLFLLFCAAKGWRP